MTRKIEPATDESVLDGFMKQLCEITPIVVDLANDLVPDEPGVCDFFDVPDFIVGMIDGVIEKYDPYDVSKLLREVGLRALACRDRVVNDQEATTLDAIAHGAEEDDPDDRLVKLIYHLGEQSAFRKVGMMLGLEKDEELKMIIADAMECGESLEEAIARWKARRLDPDGED